MTLADFRPARRPNRKVHPRSRRFLPGCAGVWLKLENLQCTHSFKVRGAFARIIELIDNGTICRRSWRFPRETMELTVALASATFQAGLHRRRAEVRAEKAKIDAIRSYGIDPAGSAARLRRSRVDRVEHGARRRSVMLSYRLTMTSVTVLGQGSLAFEILEQVPDASAVVVSVSGGGLLAGVAAAAKLLRPSIRVVGVQAEVSAAIYESLKAGHIVTVSGQPLDRRRHQGNIDLTTITFPIIRKYVDDVVLVSEEAIRRAMHHLLYKEKLLTEGSAAAAFAAVTENKVKGEVSIVAVISTAAMWIWEFR